MNTQAPDPEDRSGPSRVRAELDAIRAAVLDALALNPSTERFSSWLLVVGGGLLALQLGFLPRIAWAAILLTLASLLVGIAVCVMTYSATRWRIDRHVAWLTGVQPHDALDRAGAAARLSAAAQGWVMVQLALLIVGAAVSGLWYAIAAAPKSPPPAPAQAAVTIPHAAYTGDVYRGLDDASRGFYVAGLMDGLLGAPLLAGNAHLAETLHACLLQFHPAQTVAMMDQYVAAHPQDQQLDMHILGLQALRGACPDFESEFRATFRLP